jgi:hypothetical protein
MNKLIKVQGPMEQSTSWHGRLRGTRDDKVSISRAEVPNAVNHFYRLSVAMCQTTPYNRIRFEASSEMIGDKIDELLGRLGRF